MSSERLSVAFEGKKAFIPFVTCGDPNLETTKKLVRAMEAAGVGAIELGISFSDPTAEGPVIQEANMRALSGGVDTDAVLTMVSELRSGSDGEGAVNVPLLFMTYANVVYHYGTERFCQRAKEAGIDGLILPDVPFEEKDEFALPCEREGMCLVSMVAPSSDDRIQMIAREARGFIYLVSSMGVTGERSFIATDISSIADRIRAVTDVPVAVGFGISTPQQARSMAKSADGAIAGSAIVRLVAEYGTDAVEPVKNFVRSMVEAVETA